MTLQAGYTGSTLTPPAFGAPKVRLLAGYQDWGNRRLLSLLEMLPSQHQVLFFV